MCPWLADGPKMSESDLGCTCKDVAGTPPPKPFAPNGQKLSRIVRDALHRAPLCETTLLSTPGLWLRFGVPTLGWVAALGFAPSPCWFGGASLGCRAWLCPLPLLVRGGLAWLRPPPSSRWEVGGSLFGLGFVLHPKVPRTWPAFVPSP